MNVLEIDYLIYNQIRVNCEAELWLSHMPLDNADGNHWLQF